MTSPGATPAPVIRDFLATRIHPHLHEKPPILTGHPGPIADEYINDPVLNTIWTWHTTQTPNGASYVLHIPGTYPDLPLLPIGKLYVHNGHAAITVSPLLPPDSQLQALRSALRLSLTADAPYLNWEGPAGLLGIAAHAEGWRVSSTTHGQWTVYTHCSALTDRPGLPIIPNPETTLGTTLGGDWPTLLNAPASATPTDLRQASRLLLALNIERHFTNEPTRGPAPVIYQAALLTGLQRVAEHSASEHAAALDLAGTLSSCAAALGLSLPHWHPELPDVTDRLTSALTHLNWSRPSTKRWLSALRQHLQASPSPSTPGRPLTHVILRAARYAQDPASL